MPLISIQRFPTDAVKKSVTWHPIIVDAGIEKEEMKTGKSDNKQVSSNKIDEAESVYLYISPSQIAAAGNGLHTAIKIYKEEIIAVFKGEILTDAQARGRAKKGNDQYFISMLDGSMMDSMKTKCFAKYANDAKGSVSGFKNNAKIALDESGHVALIATHGIEIGEEIFCSYGRKYWAKHHKSE